jgi:hypothetical protein
MAQPVSRMIAFAAKLKNSPAAQQPDSTQREAAGALSVQRSPLSAIDCSSLGGAGLGGLLAPRVPSATSFSSSPRVLRGAADAHGAHGAWPHGALSPLRNDRTHVATEGQGPGAAGAGAGAGAGVAAAAAAQQPRFNRQSAPLSWEDSPLCSPRASSREVAAAAVQPPDGGAVEQVVEHVEAHVEGHVEEQVAPATPKVDATSRWHEVGEM